MGFLVRVMVTAVALWIAELLVSGITVTGGSTAQSALTLLAVAVIFGIVNAVLKPLSWLAGELDLPFHVAGFWSAFWGAIIVGVVSWVTSLAIPDRARRA